MASRRWWPLVAVLVVAFVLGVGVGRLGSRDAQAEEAPRSREMAWLEVASEPAAPRLRTRTNGDAHDEAGAVEAAARLLTLFDSPAFLDPSRRAALLDEWAAEDSRAELAAMFGQVADRISSRLGLTDDVVSEPGFVWRSVPAGWQVRSYTDDEAVVAVWSVGVFVAQGRQLDQPGWSTAEVALRWEEDAWRLVAVRNEPGPKPPLAGASDAGAVGRRIAEFRPFAHRPVDSQAG